MCCSDIWTRGARSGIRIYRRQINFDVKAKFRSSVLYKYRVYYTALFDSSDEEYTCERSR